MRNYIFLLLFLFVGCANISTYPPVENAVVLSNPTSTSEPVPTIITEVLFYAHEHFGGMEIVVFNLPKGVENETYVMVASRLGGGIPMTSNEQVAYHITELRVRGLSADADIVFPATSGGYEEATIHLESSPFGNWGVTDERVWLIPSKTAPSPNYKNGDVESENTS